MTPEQFGPYLLLKKLSEDRLGETFRASHGGFDAREKLVLLRVLNGSALEGHELWPALSLRTGVQPLLKSPNIARGVEYKRRLAAGEINPYTHKTLQELRNKKTHEKPRRSPQARSRRAAQLAAKKSGPHPAARCR